MAITEAQLKGVMKKHLRSFNTNPNITITNETIHSVVLSDSDGFGQANSKQLYKGMVRWSLKNAGDNDENWPSGWMRARYSPPPLSLKFVCSSPLDGARFLPEAKTRR